MTDFMVIDFDASGQVQAMHRESVLPLGFLGQQNIERATDIRFDADAQTWAIWPRKTQDILDAEYRENGYHEAEDFLEPPSEHAKGFRLYEEARGVEVAWLERCRLANVPPVSESGLLVLSLLRTEHA